MSPDAGWVRPLEVMAGMFHVERQVSTCRPGHPCSNEASFPTANPLQPGAVPRGTSRHRQVPAISGPVATSHHSSHGPLQPGHVPRGIAPLSPVPATSVGYVMHIFTPT
jgi:hypothetical protein